MADARDILLEHKRNLERCILANVSHRGDRATTLILDALTHSARRYLAAVTRDLSRPIMGGPYGTAGFWGPNGRGPAIDDIIKDSEIQRKGFAGEIEESFRVEKAA
jgi:hypothetical protein